MSAALVYQNEDFARFGASNDNIPLASATIIKLSTASRRGLNSQYGPRSRADFLLAMECPLDTPFDSERYRAPYQPLEALDNRSYDLNYYYNAFGHMIRTTLPTGRNISYINDGLGRHTRLKWGSTNYVSGGSYHPSGAVAGFTYADGQVFTQTLNARLQPERLLAQDGAVKALDLTYGYDRNGRITSQTNGVDSNHSRSYGYDDAGRLKTATSPSFGAGSFSYDALGNLRAKVMNGRTVTNSYDSNNRLTASHDNGTTRTVAYDNRGNITTLGNLGFVYDRADQPIVVSSGVNGNYTYDGNMKRVKAVVDGKTIYNVYDFAGRLAHVDEVTDGKETDYLHGMGQTIARIQNNNFTYLHPDHLGSAQSGTDRHGNVLWTEHYTPFGEALVNNAANDNQGGFTSHIKDKATGLNYMQARYYDPGIGRFLSIDPVTFMDTGNPSYFNRYRYCSNNPISCTDPTGMSDAFGTTDQILIDTVKYAFAPVYDFLIADGVNAVQSAANGDFKQAGQAAVLAAVKPAKILSKGKKTYQTYKKTNKDTGKVVSGRTSGTGTPEQNVANRDRNHHRNKDGFGKAKLDKSSSNSDAIRGREEQLIGQNGGAQSAGGTSGNKIRGIAENNPKREQYMKACNNEFCE